MMLIRLFKVDHDTFFWIEVYKSGEIILFLELYGERPFLSFLN